MLEGYNSTVKSTVEGLCEKKLNMFHNCETENISRKVSDVAEYIELFGSSTRDHHAGRI